jgi:hypothetical protein
VSEFIIGLDFLSVIKQMLSVIVSEMMRRPDDEMRGAGLAVGVW